MAPDPVVGEGDGPVRGGDRVVPLIDACASRRSLLLDSEESEVEDGRRLRVFGLAVSGCAWGSSGMRTAEDIIVALPMSDLMMLNQYPSLVKGSVEHRIGR